MKKTNTKLFLNVLFNCVMGVLFATVLGVNPVIGAVAVNAGGVALSYMKTQGVVLFDGLAKEVWLADVLTNPYPDATFLSAARNLSSLVDNDAINFQEAGIAPNVIVDNNVYPVPIVDASDTPKRVVLKTYDTENTVTRNAVQKELAYDQRAVYVDLHKLALAEKVGKDAAYLYAPATVDAAKANFIIDLGANDSFIDAMIDMRRNFGNAKKVMGLNLVLCPDHYAKIQKEDKELYKAIGAEPGTSAYGFKIWEYTENPIYIAATKTKAAYGAAFVPGTHKISSFIFAGDEVMVADGSADMFVRLADPEARGDVFGFQKRALATTMRGKYSGAILQ